MNIVVCVKQVPNPWAEKKLSSSDKTLDCGAVDAVVNEMDEFAVEEALNVVEQHGGEITVLCMGPDTATEAIRKALAMGADKGVHVLDDALHGSDAVATSLVLAKALERIEYDLVIMGCESSDGQTCVVPAMVSERLGAPQLTFARKVEVRDGKVRIQRLTADGYHVVEASTPAIVSVVEKINEPRYPSVKGIMAARKKPVETKNLADLGIDPGEVGLAGAWSAVEEFAERPPRQAGTIIKDDSDGGLKLAEFLAARKFV